MRGLAGLHPQGGDRYSGVGVIGRRPISQEELRGHASDSQREFAGPARGVVPPPVLDRPSMPLPEYLRWVGLTVDEVDERAHRLRRIGLPDDAAESEVSGDDAAPPAAQPAPVVGALGREGRIARHRFHIPLVFRDSGVG